MGERCEHCNSGFLGNRYGQDVECVNGVLIDIDVAHEGWEPDVVYPPAPCIRDEWEDGERDGWFEECQQRLKAWAALANEDDPLPRVGAAITCAESAKADASDDTGRDKILRDIGAMQ